MSQERMYKVIVGPHVSEKSTLVGDAANQFVFKVAPDASKAEIKSAVEGLFKVSVVGVQTLNMKGKTKRTARGMGKRSGYKKAYVKLAEGQTIDFVEVE